MLKTTNGFAPFGAKYIRLLVLRAKDNAASNKLLDRSGYSDFLINGVRFAALSTPSFDASCLKTQSTADLKIEQTRSAFHAKLRVGKRRGEIKDASNKSMNVRAKQRLC